MKSNNILMGLSILFFVLAVAFSLAFWADVSWRPRSPSSSWALVPV